MKNYLDYRAEVWAIVHSSKGCVSSCEGCWQLKKPFGCEQHNMAVSYKQGYQDALEEVKEFLTVLGDTDYSLQEATMKIDLLKGERSKKAVI